MMATTAASGYTGIIVLLFSLFFLYLFSQRKGKLAYNWPLVGMLPMLSLNFHRIHDKFTEILEQNGGTFVIKGIWFTNSDQVLTSDPANAHYILSKNFSNYPKGSRSKRLVDVLGDVLFNSDHEEWSNHRKMFRAFFNDLRFRQSSVKQIWENVEKGLIPVLNHVSAQHIVVDLQDLFHRLMLDSTCTIATGYNPRSLCIGFPEAPFSKSMDLANQRIFERNAYPEKFWMLQRWLGIGREKDLSLAKKTLHDIAAKYIEMKREDIKSGVEGFDALRFFMTNNNETKPYNFLRDTVLVLNSGGRDTTASTLTWFFWLLSKNPLVLTKIREELLSTCSLEEGKNFRLFTTEEITKLPYFHAAFCETLRLYPPAPYQQRESVKSDVLPSGLHVKPNMKVALSWYAEGRAKSIWGDDCLEVKPERWLSDKGEFKHELSNKYLFAFSAGPRVCPGKNDGFERMKVVAAAFIHNYNVEVVKGDPVVPEASIILTMKDGLMAKITNRWT